MRILVIRHGESEGDLYDVHEGRADFPLTPRGLRQAEAMAAYVVENYHIDRLYCSTLTRARQTADCLSKASGVTAQPEELLMEFNNGLIAGMLREEAARLYPENTKLPIHAAMYGMESMLEFRFRAETMLSRILSENEPDATVAVVSHGGTIGMLYRAFLRLPIGDSIGFDTGDTGIHEWWVNKGMRYVLHSNLCEHIRGL